MASAKTSGVSRGDNTFANYADANRQTVLPLASRVGCALAQWLSPQFGHDIRVVIDDHRR
jgi:hypothetical protein